MVTKSDGKEDFKEDNLDASTRIFETAGKGNQLKAKLEDFKKKILDLDPKIKAKFENNFPISTEGVDGKEGKKDFTTGYFHMTPTVAALTILSKFQNNVKNVESQVVTFCASGTSVGEFLTLIPLSGSGSERHFLQGPTRGPTRVAAGLEENSLGGRCVVHR